RTGPAEPDPTVAVRLAVRDERQRDEGTRRVVRGEHGFRIDVGQRIAVDDEEGIGGKNRQRQTQSARGAEYDRLLPRVADACREIGAVTDDGGQGFGKMMKIQYEIPDTVPGQPRDDAPDHRLACDGDRRFGANVRQ